MYSICSLVLLGACLLGVAPDDAGDLTPGGSERVDRYAVPAGGVAELAKFVAELAAFRPVTPEEDAEHRAKFRSALQQAAERIMRLEKDPASEAYRVARFILLATRIGEYKMYYQDGSDTSMPLIFGQHVRDWWISDEGKPVTRGRVVWTAANPSSDRMNLSIRLYLAAWENPHPDQLVTHLDFVGIQDGLCAPFCMAITAEEPAE